MDQIGALLFPYYDRRNKQLAAYHKRSAPFRPNADKVMPWEGNIQNISLFGEGAVSSKAAILCFGEFDAMSAHEMTGYSGLSPMNDDSALMHVNNNLASLEHYDVIYIVPDNDESGQQALNDVLELLDPTKVKVVKLPEDVKDVNDMLVAGREQEFKKCLWAGTAPQLTFVRDSEEVTNETLSLLEHLESFSGFPSGWTDLDNLLGGGPVRPGELLVIGGKTSMGKSSLARALAYRLRDHKVLFCGYEGRQTMDNLAFASLHYKKDLKNMARRGELEEVKHYVNLWKEEGNIDMVNTKIKDLDSFLRNVKVACRMRGYKVVVLDHLQFLVNAMAGQGKYFKETQVIEDFMLRTHEAIVEMDIGFVLVSHVARNKDGQGVERKIVNIEEFHGSSAIEKYSDVAIAICGERYDPRVQLRVGKNRLFGMCGDVFLTYQPWGDYL